jgi:hypothetical protein
MRVDRGHRAPRARAASNLTSLLAEQTAASLDAADLILRDAARRQRGQGPRGGSAAARRAARIPQIAAVRFPAKAGSSPRQTNLPMIDPDFGARLFFTAHATDAPRPP